MIENTQQIKDRRSAWSLSACNRWELAEGSPPGASPTHAFLRSLRTLDKDLELYWHPRLQHWVLYRVARRGACPSDDYLVQEFDVVGPHGEYRELGPWLLDILRRADKTKGGTIDPVKANTEYMKNLDRQIEEEERRKKARSDAAIDNTVNETCKYAFGRHSVHVNRT